MCRCKHTWKKRQNLDKGCRNRRRCMSASQPTLNFWLLHTLLCTLSLGAGLQPPLIPARGLPGCDVETHERAPLWRLAADNAARR